MQPPVVEELPRQLGHGRAVEGQQQPGRLVHRSHAHQGFEQLPHLVLEQGVAQLGTELANRLLDGGGAPGDEHRRGLQHALLDCEQPALQVLPRHREL